MADMGHHALSTAQLATVLEKIPVGITIIDMEGRMLYYNEYCSRFVDRKPEYIGKHIKFCHKKAESVVKINQLLDALKTGKKTAVYYEAERNGKKLGVTVTPYEIEGKSIGFIQSFVAMK